MHMKYSRKIIKTKELIVVTIITERNQDWVVGLVVATVRRLVNYPFIIWYPGWFIPRRLERKAGDEEDEFWRPTSDGDDPYERMGGWIREWMLDQKRNFFYCFKGFSRSNLASGCFSFPTILLHPSLYTLWSLQFGSQGTCIIKHRKRNIQMFSSTCWPHLNSSLWHMIDWNQVNLINTVNTNEMSFVWFHFPLI